MKITLRILNEPSGYRKHRKVYTRRSNEFIFTANPKTGFYEYSFEPKDAKDMQDQLDALFEAGRSCTYALSIVVDQDTFHALTATPRASVEEYLAADYAELDEPGLRKLCDDLAIPHNDRNTETGLREKLELYHLAQSRLLERYTLPEGAEAEKPNPELVEAEKGRVAADTAAEAEQLAAKHTQEEAEREIVTPESIVMNLGKEELAEYIEGFNDKDGLRELVERLTGESIDKRKNLANTKKYAIRHISYAQVEREAAAKKAAGETE